MLFRKTHILQWEVTFLFDYDEYDKGSILRQLLYCGAPDSIINRVSRNIDAGRLDEGFTFSEPLRKCSIVGIGRTSSGPEFLSSFCHELRHLTDDIASGEGMSLKGEKVAYLTGEVARRVSDVVCQISCPHCRSLS